MDEKEYIERNAIEYRYVNTGAWAINNEVCKAYDEGIKAMEDQIKAIPAADVAEVRHGEWIDNRNGTFTCSVCGGNSPKKRWCGDCGARMDGKGEGE